MKEWSGSWKSSTQARKQRKYRGQAPYHVRHQFLGAHLHPDLKTETGRRTLPVRKGDQVVVMRGTFRGTKGVVEAVDTKKGRVQIAGLKVKKVDGSEVARPIQASNVLITKLNMDDKMRKKIVERKLGKKPAEAPAKPSKPATKSAPKAETPAPETKEK